MSIRHRLDLAKVYLDRDMKDKAREQLDWIAKAPITEYNDKNFKEDAVKLSARLK
jgi:hypothetical protein